MQSQRKPAGFFCKAPLQLPAKLQEGDPGQAFSVAVTGMAVTQGQAQRDTVQNSKRTHRLNKCERTEYSTNNTKML